MFVIDAEKLGEFIFESPEFDEGVLSAGGVFVGAALCAAIA